MDSIFEEDADEVGGEIEAYCPSPRCKADTTHTIISMYEDEVRRVQCVVCGEVHAYRKPRGDGVEEAGEGAAKKSSQRRMTWDDAMARATVLDPRCLRGGRCRPPPGVRYRVRDRALA
jgi:Zn ribbon nucleic-acid-binding protein